MKDRCERGREALGANGVRSDRANRDITDIGHIMPDSFGLNTIIFFPLHKIIWLRIVYIQSKKNKKTIIRDNFRKTWWEKHCRFKQLMSARAMERSHDLDEIQLRSGRILFSFPSPGTHINLYIYIYILYI